MKNKWLIILLVIVIIIGAVYFLMRDNSSVDTPDDIGDNGQEEPEEDIEAEEPEIPDDSDFVIGQDIAVGKPSPSLKYEDKDGKEVKLLDLDGKEINLEDYKGKIVLLNFWGTWCKWCDVEMPDLDKLDKENDDLVVLAVNVQENKDIVQKYIDKGGYDFQVVLDPQGQIARKYLVASFPLTYFLDKEGVLLGGHEGMLEYEQMEEYLRVIRENIQ